MEKVNLYTKIPYVKKPVSRILFGTASGPFLAGQEQGELLDQMYELGIQTIDTARQYGMSERCIGKWMEERGNREELVLLSKCGHPDAEGNRRVNIREMNRDLTQSLQELRTDYIDIYLLHRDDETVPAGEVVEIFNEMRAAGKIRAFGASNWTHQRIAEANEYADAHRLIPFAVSSPNFGLAEQVRDPWGGGCVTISGKQGAEGRRWYRKTQMPVVAYSSLGRGLFSGRLRSSDLSKANQVMDVFAQKGYACEENFERLRRCEMLAEKKGVNVPQIAMAWMFFQGLNLFAVVSTSKKERMQENIDALNLRLTNEECEYLNLQREEL